MGKSFSATFKRSCPRRRPTARRPTTPRRPLRIHDAALRPTSAASGCIFVCVWACTDGAGERIHMGAYSCDTMHGGSHKWLPHSSSSCVSLGACCAHAFRARVARGRGVRWRACERCTVWGAIGRRWCGCRRPWCGVRGGASAPPRGGRVGVRGGGPTSASRAASLRRRWMERPGCAGGAGFAGGRGVAGFAGGRGVAREGLRAAMLQASGRAKFEMWSGAQQIPDSTTVDGAGRGERVSGSPRRRVIVIN